MGDQSTPLAGNRPLVDDGTPRGDPPAEAAHSSPHLSQTPSPQDRGAAASQPGTPPAEYGARGTDPGAPPHVQTAVRHYEATDLVGRGESSPIPIPETPTGGQSPVAAQPDQTIPGHDQATPRAGQDVSSSDPSTLQPQQDGPPADPGATQTGSDKPDPLLADRQRYWYGFTKATQAVILAVVVVLALLAFFLL